MNKLLKLKTWVSLSDAANKISEIAGASVTIEDVLDLAKYRKIRIFWDMRGHNLQNLANADETFEAYGHYEIVIGDYPWNNEWLTILIRKTLPNGSTIDGTLVKDKNGNVYKIVFPIPGTNNFFGGDFYPSIEDIFVNIDELTEFEENYNNADQSAEKQTRIFNGISNNSFLEAVGLMAKIIAEQEESYKKQGGQVNSQAIATLVQSKANNLLGGKHKDKHKGLSNLNKVITAGIDEINKNI
jgi:hypothetical protein